MGFAEQLSEILSKMPQQRQTLIVSATLPKALAQFAQVRSSVRGCAFVVCHGRGRVTAVRNVMIGFN